MLASRAARGGADAQTALIERMQPLLAGIARRFRGIAPEPMIRIEEGDVLVLLRAEEDLAAAEIKLMQG